MGFRFEGLGFRVWGLGFRVLGFGFWVQGSGFRAEGLPPIPPGRPICAVRAFPVGSGGASEQGRAGPHAQGVPARSLGFRVQGAGCRVQGSAASASGTQADVVWGDSDVVIAVGISSYTSILGDIWFWAGVP